MNSKLEVVEPRAGQEKVEGTLWLELWFRLYLLVEIVCRSGAN